MLQMTLAPPPQLFQPSLLGMPQLPSAQLSTVAPPVQQQPFIGLPTVPPEPPPNPIPPPPPATANIPFQHSYPPPYVLQRAVITYPVYRPDQPSQQLQTYQHSYYPPQTAYYSTNQQTVIPQQPIPQPQACFLNFDICPKFCWATTQKINNRENIFENNAKYLWTLNKQL